MDLEIFGQVLALGFVAGLLALLVAIVRFSIISGARARGAASRIRAPDVLAVEQVVGFAPPVALASFYLCSELVARRDVVLTDSSSGALRRWSVSEFIPMTALDVREWRTIAGVDGLPLASDGDKGVYYVALDGSVQLKSPNLEGGRTLVARSFDEFAHFNQGEP